MLYVKIWYHRRALLEGYGPKEFCDAELDYTSGVFKEDAKNYHAWSYRQWIIKTVNEELFWQKEIEYGMSFIFLI